MELIFYCKIMNQTQSIILINMSKSILTTRDFLTQLAAEQGFPQSRIEPIIEKLTNEWYETADSLKELSDENWNQIGLPGRVVELIKRKLNELSEKKIDKGTDKTESLLNILVEQLLSQENGSQSLRECIETLQIIIYNISSTNPIDDRVRRLKKSNPKFNAKVGRHQLAVDYLKKIGFREERENLFMPDVNFEDINRTLEEINEFAENIGIPAKIAPRLESKMEIEEFDPYKSTFTQRNPDIPKIVTREHDPIAIIEEIKKIEESHDQLARQTSVSRDPVVYIIQGNNLNAALNRLNEEEKSRQNQEDEERQLHLINIQKVMKEREAMSNFQNKRKKQLEALQKREVYTRTLVRIRFPDRTLLQGTFSVKETERDIYTFVARSLAQAGRNFHLFFAPPKTIVKATQNDLKSYAPASLLNFGWNDVSETLPEHGPFLKEELLNHSQPLA